jgi:hypothetical protein
MAKVRISHLSKRPFIQKSPRLILKASKLFYRIRVMIQPAFGKHDIDFTYKKVDDILHPEYDVTLQGQILTPDSNLTDIRMGIMSPDSK